MERLLRPSGIVINGILELGLEVMLSDGIVTELRPHTGIPDAYVLSPAFVNAHSHLEYRGLQGKLSASDYWSWIREITLAKREQSLEQVRLDCLQAAAENRRTGVALIAEHSDRPYAAEAMEAAQLGGVIFQEVITRFESDGPEQRLGIVRQRAADQAVSGLPIYPSPHAYQTVDEDTLRAFGASAHPFSIHVAETNIENELTERGSGPIADTFASFGVPYTPSGRRLVPTLEGLGLVRKDAQFVHCCAIDQADIELIASRDVSVAHCPRSNRALRCPIAPIREMLDAGVRVGLGLDSAASSGPIDIFDEMRSSLASSIERGMPLHPEEVWRMATVEGARSLDPAVPNLPKWDIAVGSRLPIIKIHVPDAFAIEDVIARGSPDLVEWE